ncbi:hypothetical protein M8C21_017103 [Ambrosia artemisiifolia]|uniref:DUF2470 domain-containing protein n=1 Tax=Ambrosia artemisiifolia TaxID=4212 RepID=A0AAD5GBW8_AMBAR|nr:hypothetical protein M8C21_017103 [Ambrosia artemisiifolia]
MMMTSSILPSVKVPMLKKGVRCSVSAAAPPPRLQIKPSPAEVSRTIMDLSSVATFSQHADTDADPPLSLGVRFALDPQGTPILSLNHNSSSYKHLPSSLNVQLEQCGLRTTQCTIQGTLDTPHQNNPLFHSLWEKRFGEKADPHSIHILHVQRLLQIDNFMDDGVWVTCSDYQLATPDPLRDFAQHFVHDINTHNMEDVLRFCNIFVDSDVQVSEAKMVWVDRLGFDIHLYSPQNDVFEVRIPFPREVTNHKSAKSSFNAMSQLAWEVEKNYHPLQQFHKVKHLKKIAAKLN